ncbi:MAG: hypothetical protein Q8M03_06770 [Legionella sp.]|nr:hypothetical protein [Legionella sp.]
MNYIIIQFFVSFFFSSPQKNNYSKNNTMSTTMMMMMMAPPSEGALARFDQTTKLSWNQLMERVLALPSSSSSSSSSSSTDVERDDATVLALLRLLPGSLREALVSTLAGIVTPPGRRPSVLPTDFFKTVRGQIAKQLSKAATSPARCDPACTREEPALLRLIARIADHTERLAHVCAKGVGDVAAHDFLTLPAASAAADQQPFGGEQAVIVVGFYEALVRQSRPSPPKKNSQGSSSTSSMAARMELAAARFHKQVALFAVLTNARSVAIARLSSGGGDFTSADIDAETLLVLSRDDTALALLDDEYDLDQQGAPKTVDAWWEAAKRAGDSVVAGEAAARRRGRETSGDAVTRESSVDAITRENSADSDPIKTVKVNEDADDADGAQDVRGVENKQTKKMVTIKKTVKRRKNHKSNQEADEGTPQHQAASAADVCAEEGRATSGDVANAQDDDGGNDE